jgi:hypothetical protein
MSNELVKRDAHGHLLPGSRLNPGGRPRSVIEDVRERLGPHTPEFAAPLVELARSPNEATRLAAIREFFDRLGLSADHEGSAAAISQALTLIERPSEAMGRVGVR